MLKQLFPPILLFVLIGCSEQSKRIQIARKPSVLVRNDFKQLYDHYQVSGSFVLFDPQENKLVCYNKEQYHQSFIPASTFKICNSLIGLETGVIKDAGFIIPWDGTNYEIPEWNADHDLRNAFAHSTVWYYQELARRVGEKRMKYWLDKASYGNADTTGGIDCFWLVGGLRITPAQQIDFLERLYNNRLPFSKRSMDIVKDIMIARDTLDYVLRAKTGWGIQGKQDIGWYVGYIETNNKVYYFANCIQSEASTKDFAIARKEIAFTILNELNLRIP